MTPPLNSAGSPRSPLSGKELTASFVTYTNIKGPGFGTYAVTSHQGAKGDVLASLAKMQCEFVESLKDFMENLPIYNHLHY